MALLVYELTGHVAVITLNRPDARNAINPEVAIGLDDAWQLLEVREVDLTDRSASDLLETDSLPATLGFDQDALDLDRLAYQAKVVFERLPGAEGEEFGLFRVTERLNEKLIRAGWNRCQAERTQAIGIGCSSRDGPGEQPDRCTIHGRAFLAPNPPLNGAQLSLERWKPHHGKRPKRKQTPRCTPMCRQVDPLQ